MKNFKVRDIMQGVVAPAESSQASNCRGVLQTPHTASGADDDGEHVRQRVLAVKLDLSTNDAVYQRLKDLSWQAARYRNLFLRARWAEAKSLCVDPVKNIPHDVTKWIRAEEKMELSGAAYSAAEREVNAAWQRHAKRILAGAPLPEWRPTAALSIRGHRNKKESGIRLSVDENGKFTAHLQVQAAICEGGSWIDVPLATGTVKDYQAAMLQQMVDWVVPIAKAAIVIKPVRHKVILQLCYAITTPLPAFGNRVATLGPIGTGGRLFLRTECQTRDFSGKLHTILDRKDHWDGIRRRALAQIGKKKGSARAKRKLLGRMSWGDWLTTFLHQWSKEVVDWLRSEGVSKLSISGLENEDWPAYRFKQMLTYKAEEAGIAVTEVADLAVQSTERAVKGELQRKRRKVTKQADALRTLANASGF